eukprot:403361014
MYVSIINRDNRYLVRTILKLVCRITQYSINIVKIILNQVNNQQTFTKQDCLDFKPNSLTIQFYQIQQLQLQLHCNNKIKNNFRLLTASCNQLPQTKSPLE